MLRRGRGVAESTFFRIRGRGASESTFFRLRGAAAESPNLRFCEVAVSSSTSLAFVSESVARASASRGPHLAALASWVSFFVFFLKKALRARVGEVVMSFLAKGARDIRRRFCRRQAL